MASGIWVPETSFSDVFTKGTDVAGSLMLKEPETIFLMATISALVVAVWWVMRTNKALRSPSITTQGEQDEMKRRVQLEETYSDKIHDFMLQMLVDGEINRKEYKRDCKRFGVAFRLTDMLRPPKSKIGIKHKVLRNVAANHSTLQFIQAGKIPGPKPGEDVPVAPVKSKRKTWIVVGKRRTAA